MADFGADPATHEPSHVSLSRPSGECPGEGRAHPFTEHELYYLRSILGHLQELRGFVAHRSAMRPSIGSEVLADNIDWLDCFIGDPITDAERAA